jgi:hypothetical protein
LVALHRRSLLSCTRAYLPAGSSVSPGGVAAAPMFAYLAFGGATFVGTLVAVAAALANVAAVQSDHPEGLSIAEDRVAFRKREYLGELPAPLRGPLPKHVLATIGRMKGHVHAHASSAR